MPIRLPHDTIGTRRTRRYPPNTARVEELGNDDCGSEPNRCVPSWERTLRLAHQGEMYTHPSAYRVGWEGMTGTANESSSNSCIECIVGIIIIIIIMVIFKCYFSGELIALT